MAGGRLNAGKLRHTVSIQNQTDTIDTIGAINITYTSVKTVWARVENKGSREVVVGNQIVANGLYGVTIRYLAGLTERNRIKFGDIILNIESIANIDMVDKQLLLSCIEDKSSRGDGRIS